MSATNKYVVIRKMYVPLRAAELDEKCEKENLELVSVTYNAEDREYYHFFKKCGE